METVWDDALDSVLSDRKKTYPSGVASTLLSRTKNKTLQTLSSLRDFDQRQVSVLLYEPSMDDMNDEYVSCESVCDVAVDVIDGEQVRYVAGTVSLMQTG